MFSFFKSSKKSPVATPTEPPKVEETTQKNGDDFVLIGGGTPAPLYPNVSPMRPPPPVPTPHPAMTRQQSIAIQNYTQNIPFKLNSALVASTNNDSELWGFKIREMSSLFQRVSATDYDFKLERSIVDS